MCNNALFYNLDFFHVEAKERLSVVCKARKVNADGLVEWRTTHGGNHTYCYVVMVQFSC